MSIYWAPAVLSTVDIKGTKVGKTSPLKEFAFMYKADISQIVTI